MYLGIDFLLTSRSELFVIEVNVGLPGGAHEYDLTHRVSLGKPSNIFERIESTSSKAYGQPFKDYLHSLPFIASLKELKICMDGMGSFPRTFHPGLRLEDKWIQYRLLHSLVPMPDTIPLDLDERVSANRFFQVDGKAALKRRLGRGGRGFQVISSSDDLKALNVGPNEYLLQKYVESKVDHYSLSIRAIAFAGRFMCMYANLSTRSHSNHGTLTFVEPGLLFGLKEKSFGTRSFNQKSWEAEIWFGENTPPYLRHNLYEEEVAETSLQLPEPLYEKIKELSVKIERNYEGLDLSQLPKACFES